MNRRHAIYGVAQDQIVDIFIRKRPLVGRTIRIVRDMHPHLLAGMEDADVGMIAYTEKRIDRQDVGAQ